MRRAVASIFAFCSLLNGVAFAQKTPLVLATDSSSKSRVGALISETSSDVVFRDIKDGIEVRTPKSILKKYEKGISDETAIRAAGLPAVVAWNVAQNLTRENPVGKVANVSQNVIYITLGSDKGIAVGQKLDVYRKKNEILDPDTKKVIAVERPRIGVLEVTEANKGVSKARLVTTLEVDLQTGDEVEPVREKAQVAVFPFLLENGEALDAGRALREDITTQLVRQEVTVLDRINLDKVLLEQALQNTVLFEPENVQKLGQLAGASTIVTGRIVVKGKLGTAYARLIDVRTGKILYAASSTMSLADAKTVGKSSSTSTSSSSTSTASVKRRPVPKGAFQSDVVEFTDNAPAGSLLKVTRVGTQIWSDRGYAITVLPKELIGGAMVPRDSEKTKEWLDGGLLTAIKDCTVYAILRTKYLGKEEIGQGTIAAFLGEGWEEVDGNFNVNFPGGEGWQWKIVKKSVSQGDIYLSLESINWGRNNPVLFVFK